MEKDSDKIGSSRVVATACNDRYAPFALNLVSSIKKSSDIFDEIIVYDLGMSFFYRWAFKNIEGVKIKKVPAFSPHYLQCWSWKIWIYNNTPANLFLYVDAGSEVLRKLTPILKATEEVGYFVVSQKETLPSGHYVKDIVPKNYYKKYGVGTSIGNKEVVAGGIVGFRKDSLYYRLVIKPAMQRILNGDNLGWSKNELFRNIGIHYIDNPPVRDCRYFRHDQTILNLLFYKNIKNPIVKPMQIYAPLTIDPKKIQYIWNPRRQNPLGRIGETNYRYFKIIHKVHNKMIINAGERERMK